MLPILLSIIAATVYSQPVPYTLQDLKNPQDVSAINQNFKYVTDYIKVQADAMSALPSNQSILSGNNAFTGDNSHGGKETFNSTTTINYLSVEGGPTWGNWIPVSSQAFAVAGSTMIFSGLSSSWTYHLEYELHDGNAAGHVLYGVFNEVYNSPVYTPSFIYSVFGALFTSGVVNSKYFNLSPQTEASSIGANFQGYFDFWTVFGSSSTVAGDGRCSLNWTNLTYMDNILINLQPTKPMTQTLSSVSIFFAAITAGLSPNKSMTGAAWLYKRRR